MEWTEAQSLARILVAAFYAVCFLDAGLDKVFHWQGNLAYLKSFFEKSPLKSAAPMLAATLTAMELTSGFLCVAGAFFLFAGNGEIFKWAMVACGLTFIALFFGQRMAKDYAAAAATAPYFIGALFGLSLA